MAIKNRDIVYVLKMRNEAKAALRAYRGDLQSAAKATAETTKQARAMAAQAKALDNAIRRTSGSIGGVVTSMNAATAAVRGTNRELARLSSTANNSAKIGRSMQQAAASVQLANGALRTLNQALNQFSRTAQRTGVLATNLRAGATATQSATAALRAATTQANAFARASNAAGAAMGTFHRAPSGGGRGGATGFFRDLASQVINVRGLLLSAAGALGAFFGGKQIFEYTDTFTALTSQLRLVTSGTQELTATYEALFKMAQNTRQSLDGTVNLYARIERATRSLNLTQQEVLDLTDSINKSVAIFGGPAASAAAALFQLSQGFAAGQLRGEELNSVLEQSPRLAQAIADGMGVAVGSLRTLAEQGQLTSEKVLKAIQSQRTRLDREFAQVGITVGQAYTVANNAVLDYIGRVDKAAQTSQDFAKSIISFSDLLRDPAFVETGVKAMTAFSSAIQGAISTVRFLIDNFYLIAGAAAGLAAALAAPAIMTMGAMFLSAARAALLLATNFNVVNIALTATVARMRVLAFLMSRTGIGLAVTAIATGIALWTTRTSETEEASQTLNETVQKIKDSYSGAADQANRLSQEAKNAAIVAANNAKLLKAPELATSKRKLAGDLATPFPMPEGVDRAKVKEVADLVGMMRMQLKIGGGDVQAFQDKLNELGAAEPNLAPLITFLLDMTKEAGGLEAELEKADAVLKLFGKDAKEAAKAADTLGIAVKKSAVNTQDSVLALSAYAEAVRNLQELSPDGKKLLDRQDAIVKANEAYATAKKKLEDLQKAGLISINDYNSELAEHKKLLQAAKDATHDLVDARKGLKEYEENANIGSIYDARQRAVAEETKQYEELIKTLEHATQAERDRATAAYRASLGNIEGQARFDLSKSIEGTLQALENENRLVGLSTSNRERMAAIIQVENAAREAGVTNMREYVDAFTREYDRLAAIQNKAKFASEIGLDVKELKKQALMLGVASDKQERLNQLIEFEHKAREAGLENVDKWRDIYVKALDEVKAAQETVNGNFSLGFGEGLREFAAEALNTREQAKELANGLASDISGAIKGALKGEKVSIGELLGSIGERFLDMAVNNIVGNIAKSMGGMFDDGMDNDPVAKAKRIVDMQMDAYLMTIEGVEGAGTNFVAGLRTSFDKLISGINSINGATVAGGPNGGAVPGSQNHTGGSIDFSKAGIDRSSVTNSAEMAAAILKKFEGMRNEAYWDVNHYRVGYGSDTVTRMNGAVEKTTAQTVVTLAEADRDLFRRIGGFQQAAMQQTGGQFGGLNPQTQAALTSIAYNYGSLPATIKEAIKSGNTEVIAQAVERLKTDNGGVNAGRRQQEADLIRSSGAQAQLAQSTAQLATNAQTAATAVTTLSNNAAQASTTMSNASNTVAQTGTVAQTASSDFGILQQGLSGLLGPLNQVVPGLGSFAQAIIGLLGDLFGGGGGGGLGGLLTGIGGLFGFANGGIMTSSGPLKMNRYARGGIAKKPQLALFGEDGRNEAYVPLPDGKTIPVTMNGQMGGGTMTVGDINIDVKMNGSSGNAEQDQKHAENTTAQISRMLDEKISDWFMRQSAPGGMVRKAS